MTSHRAQAKCLLAQPPRKWVLWAVGYHPNPASSSAALARREVKGLKVWAEPSAGDRSRQDTEGPSHSRRVDSTRPGTIIAMVDLIPRSVTNPATRRETQPAPSPRRSSPIALPAHSIHLHKPPSRTVIGLGIRDGQIIVNVYLNQFTDQPDLMI